MPSRQMETAMALRDEIEAYEQMRAEFEAEHNGSWVLIRGGVLQGTSTTSRPQPERP